jgi:hypothetical protein
MIWRFHARVLFWRGHSTGYIAQRLGRTINEVERALFVRVA